MYEIASVLELGDISLKPRKIIPPQLSAIVLGMGLWYVDLWWHQHSGLPNSDYLDNLCDHNPPQLMICSSVYLVCTL